MKKRWLLLMKCFVKAPLSSALRWAPLHLAQRPLKHNVEKKTWKIFCGKTSHHLFPVIQVVLCPGPPGCAGETHFALFRWAITQKSPSVGPRSKNITPSTLRSLCHVSGTFRCVRLTPSHISWWRWQRDKCPRCIRVDSSCGFPPVLGCPRFPPTPLQSFIWRTERQLSVKELSKPLMLIDEIICARSALSHNRHC